MIQTVSHLLLLINSSVNFLIYCSVSTQFKIYIKKSIMRRSTDLPGVALIQMTTG